MRNRTTRRIALMLLLLTAIVASAVFSYNNLAQLEQQKANSAAVQTVKTDTGTATRIVNGVFGQVEVPLHPQRLVVLDYYFLLDSVLALGIKPVGYADCPACIREEALTQFVANIPTVGNTESPSFEKILSLKPDLILAYKWQKQSYPLLSKIAPTVMLDEYEEGKIDFKRDLRRVAQILGKIAYGEAIIAEYEKRIQLLQQKIGTKLKTKTVSTVYLNYVGTSDTFFAYKPDGIYLTQILSDIGLQFVPAHKKIKGRGTRTSIEALSEYDADLLFVIVTAEKDAEKLNSLSFLKHPLWSNLKAVQNNQVYVGQWGYVGGPITANRFIDDLEEYLVNTPAGNGE